MLCDLDWAKCNTIYKMHSVIDISIIRVPTTCTGVNSIDFKYRMRLKLYISYVYANGAQKTASHKRNTWSVGNIEC